MYFMVQFPVFIRLQNYSLVRIKDIKVSTAFDFNVVVVIAYDIVAGGRQITFEV